MYDKNETNFIDSSELGTAENWYQIAEEESLFSEMLELYGYDYYEVIQILEKKGYNVELGRPLIQSFISEYFGGLPYTDSIGIYDSNRKCYISSFSDYEMMVLDLMYLIREEEGIDALRDMQQS